MIFESILDRINGSSESSSQSVETMATFTCSACNFSKPVADEMAGKKARCPECNAVNVIPFDDEPVEVLEDISEQAAEQTAPESTKPAESEVQSTAESTQPALAAQPPSNVTSSAPASNPETAEFQIEPISQGWLMALGVPTALIAVAAALFVFQLVDFAIICFALGIISFAAVSIMYCFNLGKK